MNIFIVCLGACNFTVVDVWTLDKQSLCRRDSVRLWSCCCAMLWFWCMEKSATHNSRCCENMHVIFAFGCYPFLWMRTSVPPNTTNIMQNTLDSHFFPFFAAYLLAIRMCLTHFNYSHDAWIMCWDMFPLCVLRSAQKKKKRKSRSLHRIRSENLFLRNHDAPMTWNSDFFFF